MGYIPYPKLLTDMRRPESVVGGAITSPVLNTSNTIQFSGDGILVHPADCKMLSIKCSSRKDSASGNTAVNWYCVPLNGFSAATMSEILLKFLEDFSRSRSSFSAAISRFKESAWRWTARTLVSASRADDFAALASPLATEAVEFAAPALTTACPDCLRAISELWTAALARLSAAPASSLSLPITSSDFPFAFVMHISSKTSAQTRISVEVFAMRSLCALTQGRLLKSAMYSPAQAAATSAPKTYSACSHHQSSRTSDEASDEVNIILAHHRRKNRVLFVFQTAPLPRCGEAWSTDKKTSRRSRLGGTGGLCPPDNPDGATIE